MSKFGLTTWIAILAGSVVTIVIRFPTHLWTLMAIWAIYLSVCAGGVAFIRWNFYCRAVCRAAPGRKRVALTFDDGPNPVVTPAVLDLLREEKIEAAFFCVGKNVEMHLDIAARIVAEGHVVGNHTYRHPWFICMLWARRLSEELQRGQEAIEKMTGAKPRFLRPPLGMTSLHFPKVLKAMSLTLIGWDVRSLDSVVSAPRAVRRVNRLTRDGSIILLHDGGMEAAKIVEILRSVISDLRNRGFEFERLDRLVGLAAYQEASNELATHTTS
jgi:peptidoglycan/xylan/chitin deacetylase (PgdA/CDA1 family)